MEAGFMIFVISVVLYFLVFHPHLSKRDSAIHIPVTVGDNLAIKDKVFFDWKVAILYFLEYTWRETKIGLCPWAPEIAFGHVVLKKTGFCGQKYYAFIREPIKKMSERNKLDGSWDSYNVPERLATPEAIEVALMRFVKNPQITSLSIELPPVLIIPVTEDSLSIPAGKIHFWKNLDGTLVVTSEGLLSEAEVRVMRRLDPVRDRPNRPKRAKDREFLSAFK